jgi:hypothetical protein
VTGHGFSPLLDGFGDLTKKRITVACLFVRLK